MRKLRSGAIAGIAALVLAGTAIAASPDVHFLNVSLPDGSVAHITYQGNVAPQVRLEPVRSAMPVLTGFDWPLSFFDRLSADLDRQTSLMLNQTASLAGGANPTAGLSLASVGKLPPGAVEYYETTTSTDKGVCSRSVQVMSSGPNQAPKVSTKVSGNCAPETTSSAPNAGLPSASLPSTAARQPAVPLSRT